MGEKKWRNIFFFFLAIGRSYKALSFFVYVKLSMDSLLQGLQINCVRDSPTREALNVNEIIF